MFSNLRNKFQDQQYGNVLIKFVKDEKAEEALQNYETSILEAKLKNDDTEDFANEIWGKVDSFSDDAVALSKRMTAVRKAGFPVQELFPITTKYEELELLYNSLKNVVIPFVLKNKTKFSATTKSEELSREVLNLAAECFDDVREMYQSFKPDSRKSMENKQTQGAPNPVRASQISLSCSS